MQQTLQLLMMGHLQQSHFPLTFRLETLTELQPMYVWPNLYGYSMPPYHMHRLEPMDTSHLALLHSLHTPTLPFLDLQASTSLQDFGTILT